MSPEDLKDIYATIGECLTTWGSIEHKLSQLFDLAVDAQPMRPGAVNAFWSVRSFMGKLRLVDSALKADLLLDENSLFIPKWNKIQDKLDKQNKRRNEIAHGSVTTLKDTEIVFAPFYWVDISNPDKWAKPNPATHMPFKTLHLKDLEDRNLHFHRTGARLWEFYCELHDYADANRK